MAALDILADLHKGFLTDRNLHNDSDKLHLPAGNEARMLSTYAPIADTESPAEPSRWRWGITFVVIAVLLVVFTLIVFLGLIQSVWWY
jgi:hypothetical protein